jgi:enhancing lycopene biosynthesis protein 2
LLLAKVFGKNSGGPGVKLTLGDEGENWPNAGTLKIAENFGNEVEKCEIGNVSVDENNKIITNCAYMKGNASHFQVYSGIDKMITETIKRIKH